MRVKTCTNCAYFTLVKNVLLFPTMKSLDK